MLDSVQMLVESLNASGIKYCHWKSNSSLAKALAGQTDIDLLIHRTDASRFRALLGQMDFRPAVTTDGEAFPAVEHYYALDEKSGVLVHVHAYYRIVTGESLAKNYRLPIEEMLLENTRDLGSVRVPSKAAELLIFTIRMMLKHTSWMELVLLSRYWDHMQQELLWLLEADCVDETLRLIKCWLPSVDSKLFADCITALKTPAPLFRRILLGYRLRSQLGFYARHSLARAWLGEVEKFTIMLLRRLIHSQRGMVPRNGGAIIAFVGPEATGKSTLLSEMSKWLGEHFAVEQIHVGKPKSTLLTVIPNLFVTMLRARFPAYRSTHLQAKYANPAAAEKPPLDYPLIFGVRSALLAHDRRSLLARAFSRAANGTIVLCDRYPSLRSGAPDSPQLCHLPAPASRYSIRRRLAQTESRLYREIPAPDLVIYLDAPLEVTIARNSTRGKKEPEDYVRQRHSLATNLDFGEAPICRINTDQPLNQTLLEVKKAIWKAL